MLPGRPSVTEAVMDRNVSRSQVPSMLLESALRSVSPDFEADSGVSLGSSGPESADSRCFQHSQAASGTFHRLIRPESGSGIAAGDSVRNTGPGRVAVLAGYLIRSLRGATTTLKRQPDHSAQQPCVQGFCPRLRPQLLSADEVTSQHRPAQPEAGVRQLKLRKTATEHNMLISACVSGSVMLVPQFVAKYRRQLGR